MKKGDIEKAMGLLSYILRCPVCQHRGNIGHTRIVNSVEHDEYGGHVLVHSDCHSCKSSVMFNIEIQGPELTSRSIVTDLTDADTAHFSKKAAISVDEVIGIHRALSVSSRNLAGELMALRKSQKSTNS